MIIFVQLPFATGTEGTSVGLRLSGSASDQSKGSNPLSRCHGCCLWLLIEANKLTDEPSLTATLSFERKSSKTGRNEKKKNRSDGERERKTTWRGILVAPPPHSEQARALADSPYCAPASAQYQANKNIKKKNQNKEKKKLAVGANFMLSQNVGNHYLKANKKKYVPVHSINYS